MYLTYYLLEHDEDMEMIAGSYGGNACPCPAGKGKDMQETEDVQSAQEPENIQEVSQDKALPGTYEKTDSPDEAVRRLNSLGINNIEINDGDPIFFVPYEEFSREQHDKNGELLASIGYTGSYGTHALRKE